MPARDIFHQAVKVALQKEGWLITHDPLSITAGGVDLYIDLGAERLLAAERDDEKIAVEIKSFLSSSLVTEFHTALGQFLNYRLALATEQQMRELYLAVADDTYQTFFTLPFIQLALAQYQVKVLIFNPEKAEISSWKN
ncbi:MAG: fatty-acid oxidation protein subunit alpha [Thiothrix sp.]|nr:MAG: fatty-acid oxidation protein subunit alpha [Thiothrix sp.]